MNKNSQNNNPKFIPIGKIVNTHGIKGEIRVLTDFLIIDQELVFIPGTYLYFIVRNEYKKLHLTALRRHKKFLLLTFSGYEDLNAAESLKTQILYIKEPEGKHFVSSLLGFSVVDQENNYIGEIVSFFKQMESYYSLEIKLIDKQIVNVPWISKYFYEPDFLNEKIVLFNDELINL